MNNVEPGVNKDDHGCFLLYMYLLFTDFDDYILRLTEKNEEFCFLTCAVVRSVSGETVFLCK